MSTCDYVKFCGMLGDRQVAESLVVNVIPCGHDDPLFLLDLQLGHVVAIQRLHIAFVFQNRHP